MTPRSRSCSVCLRPGSRESVRAAIASNSSRMTSETDRRSTRSRKRWTINWTFYKYYNYCFIPCWQVIETGKRCAWRCCSLCVVRGHLINRSLLAGSSAAVSAAKLQKQQQQQLGSIKNVSFQKQFKVLHFYSFYARLHIMFRAS